MQENFIYEESLSFEKLIERIAELVERFRKIQINDDSFLSCEYNSQNNTKSQNK